VKREIFLGIILWLIIFLFLAVRFSRTNEADFVVKNNNDNFVELVRVVDGDTIEVNIGEKVESVRLIGIDAPEMEEETKNKAIESKKYLENLLNNHKIFLERDETQNDRDVYGRLLRYIYLEDRTLVNIKMIEADMADEYTFIYQYKYQKEFKETEKIR